MGLSPINYRYLNHESLIRKLRRSFIIVDYGMVMCTANVVEYLKVWEFAKIVKSIEKFVGQNLKVRQIRLIRFKLPDITRIYDAWVYRESHFKVLKVHTDKKCSHSLSKIWLTVDRLSSFFLNPLHINHEFSWKRQIRARTLPYFANWEWEKSVKTKSRFQKITHWNSFLIVAHAKCLLYTVRFFSFMFFHDDSSLYTQGDWTKIKQNLNVEPLSRPLFVVFSPFSLKSLLQFLLLAFLLRFWKF